MKICLGTVQFGLNYGIDKKKIDIKEIDKILEKALIYKIDTLDTAQNYGNSEELIGKYKEKDKFKIISKISSLVLSNIDSLEELRKNLDISLNKLCVKSLDALLLHRANDLKNTIFFNNLNKLKEEGYFSKLGVSVYSVNEAEEALENEKIQYIQVPYNILDTRLDKIKFFERAKAMRKTIFVRSIFLQGTLLKEHSKYPKCLEELKKIDRLLEVEIQKAGCTKLEFLLSFIKNNKNIDYIVVGIEKLKDLEEIVEAYNFKGLENYNFEKIRENFINIPENILNPSLWKE